MAHIPLPERPAYRWWVRWLLGSQQRRYGAPLEPVRCWGRVPRAFLGFLWMSSAFKRRASPLAPGLQALIRARVSQLLQCRFCIDLNLSEAYRVGLSREKMEALERYETSPLYSDTERITLDYAAAVVRPDAAACERLLQALAVCYAPDTLIELTALISHQAMSALFNAALGIPPHGFCRLGAPSPVETLRSLDLPEQAEKSVQDRQGMRGTTGDV